MLKLLALALSLHCGEKPAMSAEDVFKKLLKAQDSQVWMTSRVSRQEKAADGSLQSVSGTLKVAMGGRARLEILEPSRQLVVCDGRQLWLEMDDVKQVMKYDAAQLRSGGNFFLDLGSSLRHYAKASLKRLILPGPGFDEKKASALELMPVDPKKAGFDSMRVWVDTQAWVVSQVSLSLGGVDNLVRFEDIKVERDKDKALSKKEFRYKAPEGYQVFDLVSMQ